MDETEDRRFGRLLRAHRVAAGLSQEELAERAHLSRRTITNLERGVTAPYRETVALLTDALELTEADRAELARAVHRARTVRIDEEGGTAAADHPVTAGVDPLLATKLAIPPVRAVLVPRPRLLERLQAGLSGPLTLLSAPAGSGKSTLLSAWANQHTAPVAWLSLDEGDSSPTRFWVSLIAALSQCGSYAPGIGETAVDLLQSPQPSSPSVWLSALIHDLGSQKAHPDPVVLIVDDYQAITDPAIHESMSVFVEHLPAHLHVILSSRADPPLPLARWRVRGQLTEIRAADLRFSLAEASRFLSHMLTPALSEAEVQRLVSRTEGWVAGLQLAALALRQREDRAAFLQALTGSQRYLLDYVQEEILTRLPADARDFLIQTAILSRLDASVCQSVIAETTELGCQQMLVLLERANLFLVPLDEERHAYRLHDLFREALLATLHSTRSEMVPVLHRRAAGFYEARGEWSEAIVHWLAAPDFSMAARLMEQTVEEYWIRGEAATLAHWVMALPLPRVREHARLVLTTALYLLNTVTYSTGEQRARVRRQAHELMARVDDALLFQAGESGAQLAAVRTNGGAASPSNALVSCAAEEALLHRRLRLLRMILVQIDAFADGNFEPLRAMEQAIEEELAQGDEPLWQLVPLSSSFILHYTVRAEGARLLPQLLAAKAQVKQAGSRFATVKLQQWLACSALDAGQLRLAYQESLAALDLIEQMTGYTLLRGYFELFLAQVLYQWNLLEEAQDLLQSLLHTAAAWQHLNLLGGSSVDLLRIAVARREWPLAQQALQEVERLAQRERFGPYPGHLPAMRAQWAMACGQVREAATWAAGTVFPEVPWDRIAHETFPVVIRVYFAQERWLEAEELLERWSGHVDRPVSSAYTITFLAQSLVALHHTGESDQARAIAARLFALTKPEGYLRVYLDEGEPMRQALQALLTPHAGHEWPDPSTTVYVSTLLSAFEQPEQDAKTAATTASDGTGVEYPGDHPGTPLTPAPGGPPLTEPLTERELDVLRLLAMDQSTLEIARSLYVEVNTVRTHIKHVYGKLGVHSRDQALWRARELALL
ncbi:MAG TPA: LuxR C-terminal-related transcriptional regulator [Chloroflexota bacterium]